MASIFTFGFSGDDIDADAGGDTDHVDDEMQIEPTQDIQQKEEEEQPELVVPQKHTLTEIVRMPFSSHKCFFFYFYTQHPCFLHLVLMGS